MASLRRHHVFHLNKGVKRVAQLVSAEYADPVIQGQDHAKGAGPLNQAIAAAACHPSARWLRFALHTCFTWRYYIFVGLNIPPRETCTSRVTRKSFNPD